MLRDLPKSVPPAILAAADGALEETEDLIQRAHDAKKAYDAIRMPRVDQHAHLLLTAQAQALIEWGAMLQDALPTRQLLNRFWRSAAAHAPCVSVIVVELALASRLGFQGGTLKTELTLPLDPAEGVFRHHEWFNGYRMTGGGVLKTAIGLRTALQPETLARIHDDVAEGRNWPHVVTSFGHLVIDHKDR